MKFPDSQLAIQVANTGSSIPGNEQENDLPAFLPGEPGTRIVEGMGLGLSIARDIIIAHGGEIKVDSTPGAGSSLYSGNSRRSFLKYTK